jgi:AcrR family transcriptional regulator
MANRRYQLKRRAEQQEETRSRIVEAAIELHQTIGPAATTFSDIAERARVGRVTVYRHFPDELALAGACSGLYFERNPAPEPSEWNEIADPNERLRTALGEVYGYHRATEAMMTHVLADARDHPMVQPYHEHWRRAAEVLACGWRARGRRRVLLEAGIALALSFDTWRTLVGERGLSQEQAVEVAARLACEACRAPSARPPGRAGRERGG